MSKKGQGLVEYALLSALVGLVVAGVLIAFGPAIKVTATKLTSSISGGYTVVDGVLIPPTSTASYTPVASYTLTNSPISTASPIPASSVPTALPTLTASSTPIIPSTPLPTWTPIVFVSSTPNVLACIPGNAKNIKPESACSALSVYNNCGTYTYNSRKDKCTWPER